MKNKLITLFACFLLPFSSNAQIFYPKIERQDEKNVRILKVEKNTSNTIIRFEYTSDEQKDRPILLNPTNSDGAYFIQANGVKFSLLSTEGIANEDWKTIAHYNKPIKFSATFEPLPKSITKFDLIEGTTGSWHFYGIELINESKPSGAYNQSKTISDVKNNSKVSTLVFKEPEIYSLQNEGAAIREFPNTESRALLVLSQGTEVMVSSISNHFCKVNSNGTVGYIDEFLLTKGSYTSKILPTSTSINLTISSYVALNRDSYILDSPELFGNVIFSPKKGEKIGLIERLNDKYYKVSYNGEIGYINVVFLAGPNPISLDLGNDNSISSGQASKRLYPSQNPTNEEEKILDSWLNGKKEALIKANGPPDAVSSDGKGGEIYSYGITQRTVLSPGISTSYHSDNPYVFEKDVTFYDPAITKITTRSRMFFINEDGIIYYWLIKSK